MNNIGKHLDNIVKKKGKTEITNIRKEGEIKNKGFDKIEHPTYDHKLAIERKFHFLRKNMFKTCS